MKGSHREVEAWHHEERPGEAICSRRPQQFGDASAMGQPLRAAAAVEWSLPELRRQLCVLQRAEPEKPLGGAQKITSGSQMLDTELFILLEFGFALFTL